MRLLAATAAALAAFVIVVAAFPTQQAAFFSHESEVTGALENDAPQSTPTSERVGYYDPRERGGRLLDWTTKHLGEPLNVIITAHSDPGILSESGMQTYVKSIGFDKECMGMHVGHIHVADLGDGEGRKDEHFLGRQSYFPMWGTCWESAVGGNHFRAWRQNGTLANSGAWFLAVSKEFDGSRNHDIIPDGYNIGRNLLVEKAVAGSHYRGKWWRAEVEWKAGLLKPGKEGVNHEIEQDGLVAILTVHRL